jgi:hypothetical protein
MSTDVIITPKFGHIELSTRLVYRDGKMIGMSTKKTYDENGKLTEVIDSETGVELVIGGIYDH